jgi:hypothetical protein
MMLLWKRDLMAGINVVMESQGGGDFFKNPKGLNLSFLRNRHLTLLFFFYFF